ncbi:MAG: hypothetical protein QOJ64_3055 [Acidobacteriota bacterium]|nr:hypothetical protein [Acidobacteriota bacterium]
MNKKLTSLLVVGLCVAGLFFAVVAMSSSTSSRTLTPAPADTIKANIVAMLQKKAPIQVLSDIPGGAQNANNRDAAYFAWQEFIALSWANMPVSGTAAKVGDPGARETADPSLQFGQPPNGSSTSYPALVWESTRHRSEIYTGHTTPPNGYKPQADVSWGYNSTPGYVYPNKVITKAPAPSNCKAINPKLTPFVNLDEGSQIGLCTMYSAFPYSSGSPGNFVFFMAKGNYPEYGYIASRGWYNTPLLGNPGTPQAPLPSFANTSGYIVTQGQLPPAGEIDGSTTTGTGPGKYVSFPDGTLEFKAAFRVSTDAERQAYEKGVAIPGGYHVAPIRYYRYLGKNKKGQKQYQYVDTCGTLLSLHIIHKTMSAPYFIFATFEHKDDIRGSDGNPVEDADGNLNGNAYTSTPVPSPTPPYVYPSSIALPGSKYLIAATAPINVIESPSQVMTATNGTKTVTAQNFIPRPMDSAGQISAKQSYYQNTRKGSVSTQPAANSPSASQSYITVNRRRFSIPSNPIVDVNEDVHKLIAKYGYNTKSNVWLNYKLVNVQWIPAGNSVQKTPGQLYGAAGAKPSIPVESFYLSNSLVETNMVLSAFSGQFNFGLGDGFSITDFYYAPKTYADNYTGQTVKRKVGDPFYNVYTGGGPYNMGGCMGCHGNTTVNGGSDASFILAGAPFVIDGLNPDPKEMQLRHQSYFKK